MPTEPRTTDYPWCRNPARNRWERRRNGVLEMAWRTNEGTYSARAGDAIARQDFPSLQAAQEWCDVPRVSVRVIESETPLAPPSQEELVELERVLRGGLLGEVSHD